jgi:acetyl-CoA carboxylase carboxyltransferase component
MTFKTPLEELEQRRQWALEHGGAGNVARQHAQGRLTIRERIDGLVDTESCEAIRQQTRAATY